MYDAFQLFGSMLILAAFVTSITGRMSQNSYRYLSLNAVGSAILTVTAIISREWGFLLLEGVWALVSAYSILRKIKGNPAVAAH
jgi:hypothetical protein